MIATGVIAFLIFAGLAYLALTKAHWFWTGCVLLVMAGLALATTGLGAFIQVKELALLSGVGNGLLALDR